MISISISENELDTILAALRLWQIDGDPTNDPIATEHGDALGIEEIDDLCERINIADNGNAPIDKRLAAIDGLKFADTVGFFAAKNTDHDKKIIDLARKLNHKEGDLEIDDPGCIVSKTDDNGAYVLAWKWIDFAGTPLDKHTKTE